MLNTSHEIIRLACTLDEAYGRKLDDYEVIQFPQTWASTALGHGGYGGDMMTTAITTVVLMGNKADVWFGGKRAYKVDAITDQFMDDVYHHSMVSRDKALTRYALG